jgi:hypothetical protein
LAAQMFEWEARYLAAVREYRGLVCFNFYLALFYACPGLNVRVLDSMQKNLLLVILSMIFMALVVFVKITIKIISKLWNTIPLTSRNQSSMRIFFRLD